MRLLLLRDLEGPPCCSARQGSLQYSLRKNRISIKKVKSLKIAVPEANREYLNLLKFRVRFEMRKGSS